MSVVVTQSVFPVLGLLEGRTIGEVKNYHTAHDTVHIGGVVVFNDFCAGGVNHEKFDEIFLFVEEPVATTVLYTHIIGGYIQIFLLSELPGDRWLPNSFGSKYYDSKNEKIFWIWTRVETTNLSF